MGSTNWEEGAHYGVETGTVYNTFYFFNNVVNHNLTWETSERLDVGLDLVLFQGRLARL